MASGVRIIGSDRLDANLKLLMKRAPKEVAKALFAEGRAMQKESMRLTPVRTGALRDSHETEKPVVKPGKSMSVRVKVGGPAAPYAVHVHYRPANHPTGSDRFLEQAFNARRKTLQKNIAKRAKKAIEAMVKKGKGK